MRRLGVLFGAWRSGAGLLLLAPEELSPPGASIWLCYLLGWSRRESLCEDLWRLLRGLDDFLHLGKCSCAVACPCCCFRLRFSLGYRFLQIAVTGRFPPIVPRLRLCRRLACSRWRASAFGLSIASIRSPIETASVGASSLRQVFSSRSACNAARVSANPSATVLGVSRATVSPPAPWQAILRRPARPHTAAGP